ncbi:putative ribonucleoprotein [Botrytis fragariae]|uniref:Putative ribonucleoprotein n=1 Tax=Botrytis fragariae TaxID=1964551 RepID=A0A8H6AI98_9HELO|nr:putative ribonucleoprotein [Botrytis fragariae]KAF5868283.1 putative ribonucleoprotein [Botrytis fragariae]
MTDSSNWRVRASANTSSESRPMNWSNQAPRDDHRQRQPIVPLAERSRAEDVKVHRPERQNEELPETLQAIAEGRRVYLGNLLYTITPDVINAFLTRYGIASVANVHISIDPFTGRCPGYCFIEFSEKEMADKAMQILEGLTISGRPVKCRPCQPKGNVRRGGPDQVVASENANPGYNRWGNWDSRARDSQHDRLAAQNGPNDALRYFQISKATEEGRQLYVGGLPRMLDQTENESEIRSIFEGFKVDEVSKRVSPRKNNLDNRRNFCFVDFVSREEAEEAMRAIDGTSYRESPLKVSMSITKSQRDRTSDREMEMGMERNSRWE